MESRFRARPSTILRLSLGALAFWLALGGAAEAVIPGLAPGLVAILPQLILFTFAALMLLFSPRAWWRFAAAAARRPVRTGVVILAAAAIVIAARALPALFPPPAPGAEIALEVAGYPVGDAAAARRRAAGPGPITAPAAASSAWSEWSASAAPDPGGLVPLGDRALALLDGGRRLGCLDPGRLRPAWEALLEAPAALAPLAFERRLPDGARMRGAIVLTASESTVRAPAFAAAVIDGRDGSILARAGLPGAPQAAAIVDERLIVALERSIACYSLAAPASIEMLWARERPTRPAVALAGDACGRYFLLDAAALHAGDLAGGALRRLAGFDSGAPLRLAVHAGRAFVLAGAGEGRARLAAIDPALADGDADSAGIWSIEIERPAGDDLAAGDAGIAIAHRTAVEILDPATGARRRRLDLDAPPACPPVVAGSGCVLLLASGEALRWSPEADRISWRVALAPLQGAAAIAAAGDRLVADLGGRAWVLEEIAAAASAPWGQWRGGPERAGTAGGDAVPLTAALLWTRPAPGGAVAIALAEGWLTARSDGGGTGLEWIDDGGVRLAEAALPGRCAALARLDGRIFAALRGDGAEGDQVACLTAERPLGRSAALRPAWRVPAPALGERWPLAAAPGRLLVAGAGSLRALDADSGAPLWESGDAGGAAAPLIAGGRAFAAGPSADSIAALDLRSGERIWLFEAPGLRVRSLGAAGGSLYAAAASAVEEKSGSEVIALSIADGKERWRFAVAGEAIEGPVAAAGGRLVFLGAGGALVTLSEAGEEVGRRGASSSSAAAGAGPAPVAAFGADFIARGSVLSCLDAASRDAIWEVDLPAPARSIALARGRILAVLDDSIACIGAE